MPPPKRPKQGRTTMEQFLSEEELKEFNRKLRDSQGSSPSSSAENGSHGETFIPPKSISNDIHPKPESDKSLFHTLFYNSNILDEQKALANSPREEFPWQTAPLPAGCILQGALKRYPYHLRYLLEKLDENEKPVKLLSETSDNNIDLCNKRFETTSAPYYSRYNLEKPDEDEKSIKFLSKTSDSNVDLSDKRFQSTLEPEQTLSNEHGRISDTFVASALANSAFESIIYKSAQTPASTTVQKYAAPNTAMYSDCTATTSLGTEPPDFSQMSEENGSFFNQRLTENSTNTNINDPNPISNMCHELARRQNTDTSASLERSKRYSKSYYRIARLLSERPGDVGQQIPVRETDNPVQSVPGRYSNGFYTQGTLNETLNSQQHGNNCRESLDTSFVKLHQSTGLMSLGSYMTILPKISTSGPINQSLTSMTPDHVDTGDHLHPPLPDEKRIKHVTTQGSNINKLCQVCSDNASGFHYGVWSCEGCKAFFKRSIQGPVDYLCPAKNTCTIDKHRRKSCQACRLRKCYKVGMNKGSQRKERKAPSASQNGAPKRSGDVIDEMHNDVTSSPTLPKNSRRKSRTSLVIESLRKADGIPNVQSHHSYDLPDTSGSLLTTFVRHVEEELMFLVNFAKHIPGYEELVSVDQEHLLKCSWIDFMLLKYAICSMEYEGRKVVIASDFVLERDYWPTTGMEKVLEQVADISKQLMQHGLHNDELLLLQATVVINSEIRELASGNQLNDIRGTILDSIIDIAQKYHPDDLRHVPSMILLLAHIRLAAEWAMEYFQSVKNEANVTFYDFLSEMLQVKSKDNTQEYERLQQEEYERLQQEEYERPGRI